MFIWMVGLVWDDGLECFCGYCLFLIGIMYFDSWVISCVGCSDYVVFGYWSFRLVIFHFLVEHFFGLLWILLFGFGFMWVVC
jgi:hypothetical protein